MMRLRTMATMVRTDTYMPTWPMKLATRSSFYCNGVPSTSSVKIFSSTSPAWVSLPTAQTSAVALPRTIIESPRRNGSPSLESRGPFLTWSLSPVLLLSSVLSSSLSITRQSAGTRSPYLRRTISPTTKSNVEIDWTRLSLMTSTYRSFRTARSLLNCFSFM